MEEYWDEVELYLLTKRKICLFSSRIFRSIFESHDEKISFVSVEALKIGKTQCVDEKIASSYRNIISDVIRDLQIHLYWELWAFQGKRIFFRVGGFFELCGFDLDRLDCII